jgi:acyl-coenzyme A thioesterase PaaI-like protein
MTEDELQARLEQTTPPSERHGLFVEDCRDQDIRVRFSLPAGGWSTAALLAVADGALRATGGGGATITHLSVTMIRPAQQADIFALSRVIRRDRETVYAEAWLFCHAVVEPMLHATASLRMDSR